MPPILAFAACFVCCLAELLTLDGVGRVLAQRHPEIWRQVSARGMTPHYALYRFAQSRGDRGLGDSELTRWVQRSRILHFVMIGLCVVYGVVLVISLRS
ncbi:MAG TPA: hypothetical protein VN158_02720 [Caulobacter sp.]|nr:hypothetical protein [Caulobacter sp.]